MQIEVKVKGQQIKRLNSPGSVEDTLNYLTCHFTFDGSEWENTIKTAYFKNRATEKIYSSLIADDGTCTVPWESLTDKGCVEFSAAGERENYRITTGIESFYNSKTVYGGEPSEPPTPDQYDQMIALAEQTKEIAESVRRDADEGKFDGDPGEPGEPGEPGAPGRDGVSPTAKVEQTDDGAVITITDATGTTTAELKNGKEGNPGQNATDEQVRGAVDAYMAEHPVQVDTDDLIKIAIKEEASGAVPIVTTDSAEMGVQDIKMQGWTEQDSTEGKNLFEIPDITAEIFDTKIECNITQPITISATNEVTVSTKIWRFRAKYKDGTYAYAVDMDSSFVKTFDASEENPISEITYRGAFITSGAYRNVQIEYGESATAYEPYTGGQPSPSPDYPQEITSAGKYDEGTGKYQYEVKLTGANLWDATKAADTSNWVASTLQSGYSDFTIDVSAGKKVTVSFPEKLPTGIRMYVGIVLTEDGNIDKWMYHSTVEHLIFQQQTVTAITDKIWIRCNTADILKFVSNNPYFQIEYGEKRTDFQPYKNQTVTLTSDRPLTKWDRLEKRNGQWGWVYKSAEIVLDGSEDEAWRSFIKDSFNQFYIDINTVEHLSNEKNAYCKKFRPAVIADRDAEKEIIYSVAGGIAVSTELATELDAWKTWIQSNPITVLYRSIEETFVPLSKSEQSALNALTTYYPTTVLDNDQGCDMALTYIADTKAYIDNKVSAIQAAIVNTI